MLCLTRGRDAGIERKVARKQQPRPLTRHGLKVAREALGGGFVGAYDEHGHFQPLKQRGGEIDPMHPRKSGNERGKSSALQKTGEGGCLFILKDLLIQDIHS